MKVKISNYPKHRWYHNWLYEKFGYSPKQSVKVHIDEWDTWSMDHTLAEIVVPMLKQLKDTQQGAANTDDEDVPEELRSTSAPLKENEWDIDDNHFKRWDWILDEMIFAFESKLTDWEEQFQSGEVDIYWEDVGNDLSEMKTGPKDTFEVNWDGRKAYQDRISNGFRLFGKYYENLWD